MIKLTTPRIRHNPRFSPGYMVIITCPLCGQESVCRYAMTFSTALAVLDDFEIEPNCHACNWKINHETQ